MNRRSVLRAGVGALFALPLTNGIAVAAGDPTDGWTQTSFTYSWQKPWNLDLSDRHSYSGGVHRMWVYATDEPFQEGSDTDPRTEMRWQVDYSTGDHMWDADVYLPSGTDGAIFVQILRSVHPSGTPATDVMLDVYDTGGGTVRRYDGTVLKTTRTTPGSTSRSPTRRAPAPARSGSTSTTPSS
jgi:hypothetical protein